MDYFLNNIVDTKIRKNKNTIEFIWGNSKKI